MLEIRLKTNLTNPSQIWEGSPAEIAANITGSIERVKRDPENGLLSWQPINGSIENAVKWLKDNRKLVNVVITKMTVKKTALGSYCESSIELYFESLDSKKIL